MADRPLDPHSLKLLAELQRDARQTVQQLAERVGLSATPCWKRIKEMEEAGVIRGYAALVDREQVGLNLSVMVEVNLSPQIVHCVSTTGQADYVLTVLATGIKEYEQLLHDTLFKLPGVTHLRSSIVLKEVKAGAALPLQPPAARPARRGRAGA